MNRLFTIEREYESNHGTAKLLISYRVYAAEYEGGHCCCAPEVHIEAVRCVAIDGEQPTAEVAACVEGEFESEMKRSAFEADVFEECIEAAEDLGMKVR